MKLNYAIDMNNKELVDCILEAIDWEKCDMLLALNSEAQKKQESIIASNEATTDEITVAKSKLAKLKDQEEELKVSQDVDSKAHVLVLDTVSSANNEHIQNDRIAVRNILRLSACDENVKFFKMAIITDNVNFETFYDSMVALHDMESEEIAENGLRNYSAKSKKVATELSENIQSLIKSMFSIQVENAITKKINVKFNKTDLNCIHETFVSGLAVDIAKLKSGTKVEGMSFRYAIEKKKDKTGNISYTGARFKETLAKIAFTKLFK